MKADTGTHEWVGPNGEDGTHQPGMQNDRTQKSEHRWRHPENSGVKSSGRKDGEDGDVLRGDPTPLKRHHAEEEGQTDGLEPCRESRGAAQRAQEERQENEAWGPKKRLSRGVGGKGDRAGCAESRGQNRVGGKP